jgi:Flp pilus assembly protein TadD
MFALNHAGRYLLALRAVSLLVTMIFLNACMMASATVQSEEPTESLFLSQFEDKPAEEITALGDEAWQSGELERAVFIYMQSLAVEDNPDVWMKVGKIQEHEGRTVYAWQAYERVVALDPEHADAYERLGMLYLGSRQKDLARTNLKKAIELDETRWIANNALGVLADTSREYEQAIGYYEAALEHNPDSAMLMTNMGYSFYLSGKLDEAERLFIMAIGIDREYKAAASNLGLVRARRGKYDSAVDILENVMPRRKALNDVGYMAFRNGDIDEAERLLDDAVRSSPTYYKTAHENLARVKSARQERIPGSQETESAVGQEDSNIAGTPAEFRRVSADRLNVRRSDSMTAPVVGFLAAENRVRVLENKGSWAFVKYDDGSSETPITGWVMSEFLANSITEATTPTP